LQEAGTIEVMETSSGSHLTSEPYVDCNDDDDNPSASLSDENGIESQELTSDSDEETLVNEGRMTRVRRQPKIFTYDTLGQPSLQKCSVKWFSDAEIFV
jgi:hypothetical protein